MVKDVGGHKLLHEWHEKETNPGLEDEKAPFTANSLQNEMHLVLGGRTGESPAFFQTNDTVAEAAVRQTYSLPPLQN